jgi:hypothetical protein
MPQLPWLHQLKTVQSTNHELTPQGMRVLRQSKVPRAEVMFVIIQIENISPSKKEMNKAVTMLIIN